MTTTFQGTYEKHAPSSTSTNTENFAYTMYTVELTAITPYYWLQQFMIKVSREKTKYTFELTEIKPAENLNTNLNKYHLSTLLL